MADEAGFHRQPLRIHPAIRLRFEERRRPIVDNGPGGDLERYARFETSDGGETWSIKEQNKKPLQLKRTAAPASTWRVRADAATRSYRIEHRAGNQWTAAAAFSVKLPSCKPE